MRLGRCGRSSSTGPRRRRAAGSYSTGLDTLEAARADVEKSGRPDLLLRAEGLRGNLLSRLGQSAAGIAAVRTALDQALADSLPDTAAELHQRLADALEHSGDYQAATAVYAAGYQFCDAHGADATGQLCRACATVVLFTRGDWDRAAAVCEDVLTAPAVPHARGAAADMLGLVYAMRGAVRQSRPHLLESYLIARRIELVPMELFSSWGLCILDSNAGSSTDAAERPGRCWPGWRTRRNATTACRSCSGWPRSSPSWTARPTSGPAPPRWPTWPR